MNSTINEVKLDPLMRRILLMIYNSQRPVRPIEIEAEFRVGSKLFSTLERMKGLGLIEYALKRQKLSAYGLTQTGLTVVQSLSPDYAASQNVKTDVEKSESDLTQALFDSYLWAMYTRPDRIKTIKNSLAVRSEVQRSSIEFLRREEFIEIQPVMISPITDPLRHSTYEAQISYCGQTYRLTQSMIFHKQIAVCSLEKIFTLSPNVRLEPPDHADTGRHLVEFVQLDLEVRDATRSDMINLAEQLLIYVLTNVKKRCKKELESFRRQAPLEIPKAGFQQLVYEDQEKNYGNDFCDILSYKEKDPFWIVDFPIESREFYDKEDPTKQGKLVDMDLILPEGYGEVLSGGEREYRYDRLLARMKRIQLSPREYELYLLFAKRGLKPSAGFGLGIERLVNYICGLRKIEDTTFFPKIPGNILSL